MAQVMMLTNNTVYFMGSKIPNFTKVGDFHILFHCLPSLFIIKISSSEKRKVHHNLIFINNNKNNNKYLSILVKTIDLSSGEPKFMNHRPYS